MTKRTIDGVDIIEDGNVTHFTISEDVKKEEERKRQEELDKKAKEPTSFWGKIVNWFKTSKVTPYVKIRDLADPFGDRINNPDDIDAGSDGINAAEIGIKIKF